MKHRPWKALIGSRGQSFKYAVGPSLDGFLPDMNHVEL
jgi:hypothetical protein